MFIFLRRVGSKINVGKGEIAFNVHEHFFSFPLCLLSFYYIVFLEKIKFHIDLHPCFLGKEAGRCHFYFFILSRFIRTMILESLKKICPLESMFLLKINP